MAIRGGHSGKSYKNDKILAESAAGKILSHEITRGENKGKITVRLEWNPDFHPRLFGAFQKTQYAFSQEVARKMDVYVPFDTGLLKTSVMVASDFKNGELVYATPYARSRYYLHPMGSHVHDGKRGSYWGQRCIADNKAHFSSFAKGYFRKEMGR